MADRLRLILGQVLAFLLASAIAFYVAVLLASPPAVLTPPSSLDATGWPDIRDAIVGFLLGVWSVVGVRFLVCHILVNTIAAIAASVYMGEFLLSRVAEFLHKKLLPYVTIYYVLVLVEQGANLAGLSVLAWTAIEASLLGDLLDTWERCGLPLPDFIRRYIRKGGGYGRFNAKYTALRPHRGTFVNPDREAGDR